MSLLVFVIVAFVFAGLAAVTREDVRARTALGLVGLVRGPRRGDRDGP